MSAAKAQLQALEAETQRLLNAQNAAYANLAYSKQQAEKILADQAARSEEHTSELQSH